MLRALLFGLWGTFISVRCRARVWPVIESGRAVPRMVGLFVFVFNTYLISLHCFLSSKCKIIGRITPVKDV